MTVYSLSPGAYSGLLKLANDPRWCADYTRLLRYLDVVVSMKEADLLPDGVPDRRSDHTTWVQVAFLDDRIAVPATKRRSPPFVIKKI